MKFIFNMTDKQVDFYNFYLSTEKAKEIMKSKFFYDSILDHGKFDYTEETPEQIAKHLRLVAEDDNFIVKIGLYRPWWYFSKALAMTIGNTISFNTRKMPMKFEDLVSVICHELVHVAGYGHGDNYSAGKEKSVPYAVNKIVDNYFKN